MTTLRISIALVASTALFTACKKTEGASAKPTEGEKAPTQKLAKLGLQLDAPGEIEASDGMSDHAVMLQGSGIGAMQVEIPKTPQTLDEAKSDAGMYTPRNLKAEKLADGWLLTFENTGGAGTNYWVDSRRDLGGKTYRCGTTGSDPDQAKAVAAACRSLRL